MGDSGSYIWTALSGSISPDRSFIYGYVIRWSVWTESLDSLVILQTLLGAGYGTCFHIYLPVDFSASSTPILRLRHSLLHRSVAALWEHYVMTETISLFLYVVLLRYSFLYVRDRRVRDLVFFQILAIVSIVLQIKLPHSNPGQIRLSFQ